MEEPWRWHSYYSVSSQSSSVVFQDALQQRLPVSTTTQKKADWFLTNPLSSHSFSFSVSSGATINHSGRLWQKKPRPLHNCYKHLDSVVLHGCELSEMHFRMLGPPRHLDSPPLLQMYLGVFILVRHQNVFAENAPSLVAEAAALLHRETSRILQLWFFFVFFLLEAERLGLRLEFLPTQLYAGCVRPEVTLVLQVFF